MKAIIAVNNLSFIGIDDRLLWYNKEDLKFFKEMTLNQRLLVGYRTYQSLPLLKNRELVVDERDKLIIDNIDWCIGGKKTYEKYCHLFTELHISHINDNSVGNVTFPNLEKLNSECVIYNHYY